MLMTRRPNQSSKYPLLYMYYKSLSLSHTHPLSFSQGEIVVNVKDALLVQAFLSGVVVFLPTTKNLVFGVCVVFPKITFYHIFFFLSSLDFRTPFQYSNISLSRGMFSVTKIIFESFGRQRPDGHQLSIQAVPKPSLFCSL